MLAYVFRHWPSQSSDRGDYEATHLQFHQSIANESPAGFHRSFVFRLVKARWIAATGSIYEDWYLVENFAALESLNEGAVSGKNRSPHDRIAQRASGIFAATPADPPLPCIAETNYADSFHGRG